MRLTVNLATSIKSGATVVLFAHKKASKPVASYLFGPSSEAALQQATRDGFSGNLGECTVTRPPKGKVERYLVVGLGPEKNQSPETTRSAISTAVRTAEKLKIKSLFLRIPLSENATQAGQCGAEGALLGAYQYNRYKTTGPKNSNLSIVTFIAKDAKERSLIANGTELGQVFAEGTIFARDLINLNPSDTTPEIMGKFAKSLKSGNIKVTVYNKAQITKMKMGGLLGVNRGSAKPPAFVHLTYKPRSGRIARRIGICGKGITFDSGGLSLKPSKAMETMKLDMSGAAAVFGIFKALAKLKPNVEVHGFTPLTENLPGPLAVKPGDVLSTFGGKTIEVLNTDAEGRLVLADALGFACKQNIDEVIDVATLTGAAIIALGSEISAIMGTDEKLIQKIKDSSKESGEKVWELPLNEDYRSHLDSTIADIKNMGKGEAGTIIGGLFLKDFVVPAKPWVHIDIAGPAFFTHQTPLSPAGGTGVMVRTLLHYIMSYN